MNLRNVHKMIIGICFTVAIAILVALIAVARIDQINKNMRLLSDINLPKTPILADLTSYLYRIRQCDMRIIRDGRLASHPAMRRDISRSFSHVSKDIDTYKRLPLTEAERRDFTRFETAWSLYMQTHNQTMALVESGKEGRSRKLLSGQLQSSFASLDNNIKRVERHTIDLNARMTTEQSRMNTIARYLFVLFLLVAVGSIVILYQALDRTRPFSSRDLISTTHNSRI